MTHPNFDAVYQKQERLIREHGWMVTLIAPGVGQTPTPAEPGELPCDSVYVYTSGLGQTTGEGTELILTGIDLDLAHSIMNEVATQLKDRVIVLPRDYGTDLHDVLDGLPLRLRPVHSDWLVNFGLAHRYGRTHPLPDGAVLNAAQILLPDQHGRFSGDLEGSEMDIGTPAMNLPWARQGRA